MRRSQAQESPSPKPSQNKSSKTVFAMPSTPAPLPSNTPAIPSPRASSPSTTAMETIWVTEQFDGAGILYSCIACCDEVQAKDCYQSFEEKLSAEQRDQGWNTQQRQVTSWDDVPVSALKLSR